MRDLLDVFAALAAGEDPEEETDFYEDHSSGRTAMADVDEARKHGAKSTGCHDVAAAHAAARARMGRA